LAQWRHAGLILTRLCCSAALLQSIAIIITTGVIGLSAKYVLGVWKCIFVRQHLVNRHIWQQSQNYNQSQKYKSFWQSWASIQVHAFVHHTLRKSDVKTPSLVQFARGQFEVCRDMMDIAPAGLLPHDVCIWCIEAQGSCRQPVCHKIDPQQLHRVERLWHAKQCRKEDSNHLPNVGGDHVANEL